MGNYNSFLSNIEDNNQINMEISDTESEEPLVINRSYSDSALEIMTESQRDKIVKAVGDLDINNKKVENAISCIYLKDKLERGFRNKIDELNEKLKETEDQLDDLHFINSRLRHKNDSLIRKHNEEKQILKQQLNIITFKYEELTKKKYN